MHSIFMFLPVNPWDERYYSYLTVSRRKGKINDLPYIGLWNAGGIWLKWTCSVRFSPIVKCCKKQHEKLIFCHNRWFCNQNPKWDLDPSLLSLINWNLPHVVRSREILHGQQWFGQERGGESVDLKFKLCYAAQESQPWLPKLTFFKIGFNKEWVSGEYVSSCSYQENALLCDMWSILTRWCGEACTPFSQIHTIRFQELHENLSPCFLLLSLLTLQYRTGLSWYVLNGLRLSSAQRPGRLREGLAFSLTTGWVIATW